MEFVWMIVVGLVAGLLARAIKPGNDAMGWIMTIVLGIVGAIVGGLIASALHLDGSGKFMSLVFSVIGAIILLFIYEFIMSTRRI